jgi:predicted dehydrogenase
MAVDGRLGTAVVGCGLIGARRAQHAAAHDASHLVLAVDASAEAARVVAERYGAQWSTDWRVAIDDPRVGIVTVATPNAFLAPIALAALERGKHVLIEKPMGRTLTEARALETAAAASNQLLKIGFNHRYHPAIHAAHERVASGSVGTIISIRARYGHGGRPGYEREWRGNAELAGGGELTDQGVHVADLIAWFAGIPDRAFALLQTAVWPIAPLEDNAFGLLQYDGGCVASFHTSWTQWKNLFSFEVFGTLGSVAVEGLGGSYGIERLITATRNPLSGVPAMTDDAFDGPDASWAIEWDEFVGAIVLGRPYMGTPQDGVAAMRIVQALYESARDGALSLV